MLSVIFFGKNMGWQNGSVVIAKNIIAFVTGSRLIRIPRIRKQNRATQGVFFDVKNSKKKTKRLKLLTQSKTNFLNMKKLI